MGRFLDGKSSFIVSVNSLQAKLTCIGLFLQKAFQPLVVVAFIFIDVFPVFKDLLCYFSLILTLNAQRNPRRRTWYL